jgi:hypothetical protein
MSLRSLESGKLAIGCERMRLLRFAVFVAVVVHVALRIRRWRSYQPGP